MFARFATPKPPAVTPNRSAMSLSLRSVILVELFGIRRLTNAFGYLLIFQGLAVILGPPLFGKCSSACIPLHM